MDNIRYVDDKKINEVIDAYFLWKKLDEKLKTLSSTRGINFPSELSEYIVCYVLGYAIKTKGSGDAVDLSNEKNPRIIEIKGSSATNIYAPNSFSPSENFDELIFIRLEKDLDICKIYCTGLNSEDIKEIKVNKIETFGEQQKQGRRPRFSIQKQIIEALELEPDYIFEIKKK